MCINEIFVGPSGGTKLAKKAKTDIKKEVAPKKKAAPKKKEEKKEPEKKKAAPKKAVAAAAAAPKKAESDKKPSKKAAAPKKAPIAKKEKEEKNDPLKKTKGGRVAKPAAAKPTTKAAAAPKKAAPKKKTDKKEKKESVAWTDWTTLYFPLYFGHFGMIWFLSLGSERGGMSWLFGVPGNYRSIGTRVSLTTGHVSISMYLFAVNHRHDFSCRPQKASRRWGRF